jgi:hypothetical protein
MKKLIFLASILAIVISCKNLSEKKAESGFPADSATKDFVVYKFKVTDLNNSAISDSIWKMIFKVPGIDELNIDKLDSLVVVKIEADKADKKQIATEIEKRGGKVLRVIE